MEMNIAPNIEDNLNTKELSDYKKEDLDLVTNENYHCNLVRNEPLKCEDCHSNLYLLKDKNKVCCLNCLKLLNFDKEYIAKCDTCSRNYTASYKIYDEDDFAVVKQVVKFNLKDKLRARPQFIKKKNYICSCIIGARDKYYHSINKECKGVLYKGEIDNNTIIICNDCMFVTIEKWMIWTCPKCGIEFTEKGPVEPIKPVESKKGIIVSEPIKLIKTTVEQIKSIKLSESKEPINSIQSIKTEEIKESVKPIEIKETIKFNKPTELIELAESIKQTELEEPIKLKEPIKPTELIEPIVQVNISNEADREKENIDTELKKEEKKEEVIVEEENKTKTLTKTKPLIGNNFKKESRNTNIDYNIEQNVKKEFLKSSTSIAFQEDFRDTISSSIMNNMNTNISTNHEITITNESLNKETPRGTKKSVENSLETLGKFKKSLTITEDKELNLNPSFSTKRLANLNLLNTNNVIDEEDELLYQHQKNSGGLDTDDEEETRALDLVNQLTSPEIFKFRGSIDNHSEIEITNNSPSVSRKNSSKWMNELSITPMKMNSNSNISITNNLSNSKSNIIDKNDNNTFTRSYSHIKNLNFRNNNNYSHIGNTSNDNNSVNLNSNCFSKRINNTENSNPLIIKKPLNLNHVNSSRLLVSQYNSSNIIEEKAPTKYQRPTKLQIPINSFNSSATKIRSTSSAVHNLQFDRKQSFQSDVPLSSRMNFNNDFYKNRSSVDKNKKIPQSRNDNTNLSNINKNQNINININIKGVQNLTLNNGLSNTSSTERFKPLNSSAYNNNTYPAINENSNSNYININSFKIIKQIGEGTFAKIYKVEEISTGKEFALKKFIGHSKEELKNVYSEFECLSKYQHLNILRIFGMTNTKLDNTTYVLYILMENAQCDWYREIRNRIALNKPYKEKEIINILCQLTSAFSFLQKQGISHRDIKPQNILLFKGGIFKIADFGEAKVAQNKNGQHTVRGSELYMSPSLFKGLSQKIKKISHNPFKSDVFSLGMSILLSACLNFELLYSVRQNSDPIKVKQNVDLFLRNKGYSHNLIGLLLLMVSSEEVRRPDFLELESIIIKNKL